jgi:hypothetical protein
MEGKRNCIVLVAVNWSYPDSAIVPTLGQGEVLPKIWCDIFLVSTLRLSYHHLPKLRGCQETRVYQIEKEQE